MKYCPGLLIIKRLNELDNDLMTRLETRRDFSEKKIINLT